jgi:8-oxo-dGTP diphosphatase
MIRAAGAILWRQGADGVDVALIHRPRKDDWSFPKGRLEPGEDVQDAAVREVREETGLTPSLGTRLPPRFYLKGRRLKRVDYWTATTDPEPFRPNSEADMLEWLSLPEARRRLTHRRDQRLLDAFARRMPARGAAYGWS